MRNSGWRLVITSQSIMALFAKWSLALFLFQVIAATRAHQPDIVIGPQEHLDSGQKTSTRPHHKPFVDQYEHPGPSIRTYDSDEEFDYDEDKNDDFIFPRYRIDYSDLNKIEDEGRNVGSIYANSGEDSSYEYNFDDYEEEDYGDDNEEDEDDSWERVTSSSPQRRVRRDTLSSIEKVLYPREMDLNARYNYPMENSKFISPHLVVRRIRRRIIPVGKALDRDRADRNPYDRSRSPWEDTPNRNRDSVVRRNGPTASAALVHLFPELALPEEAPSKPKKKSQRDTEATNERSGDRKASNVGRDDRELEEKRKPTKMRGGTSKSAGKKKLKLSKQMKEDVAVYAEEHGIQQAIAYFKPRLSTQLKPATVEKFLRRYQTRLQRKGGRKPTRS